MALHSADLSKYIGVPYRERDCWNFVRWFLNEQYGLLLPELSGDIVFDFDDQSIQYENERKDWRVEWRQVERPQAGDVVTFACNGVVYHVGVMIDEKRFLHSTEDSMSVLEKLTDSFWQPRIDGFYRHQSCK